MLGIIRDNNCQEYFESIENVTSWCSENKIILNEKKTKELVFDSHKPVQIMQSVLINEAPVERVESLKYLGVHIDKNLKFNTQATYTLKKVMQRRFLVYQPYNFNIDRKLTCMAYTALVRSVIQYSLPSYYNLQKR